MNALFDKDCNLVGWHDQTNIFDLNMDWVAFIAGDKSVWNVSNMNWVGHIYGNNLRDTNGKTMFWNPDTPIENSLTPFRPFKPFMPFKPFKPFKPFTPFKPFKPFTPVGGWSNITWNQFVNL